MQTLAFIKCFLGSGTPGLNTIPPAAFLPFNPLKLLFLIIWVYLCLYFVQYLQFSPLVPKRYKLIASIAALFAGPILFFVLATVDLIKTCRENHDNITDIFEAIKDRLRNMGSSLNFAGQKNDLAIKLLNSSGTELKEIYGRSKGNSQARHILKLTEQIIADALENRASDILIDPKDNFNYTIRFRIDGVLSVVEEFDTNTCKAVINSIKAISNMDIAETRRPQDGSFTAKTEQATAAFRVASAGALNGEKLSVRVLNQDAGSFNLANLGLSTKQQTVIKNIINKPSGMALMCGPTGSGKTTTLYGILNEIDMFTRNVITVEDPIECLLPNTSQIEVNPKADITFAKSLRSILRQDPDVICVGEIRDEETAKIALQASQTGHLVLATIHSNSNASAMVRLLDLDVTPLLLSSGLSLIVSQRLVRLLCNNCKVPAELSQSQIYEFRRGKVNYANMFQATGCEQCNGTGYRGRTAIFDILILDDKIKAAITANAISIATLRNTGDKKGSSNLHKQGLLKVVSGLTSFEELNRVIG